MDNGLDINQITQRLQSAFHPYQCVVETKNYENDIWIRILDQNGKSIIRTPWVAVHENEYESSLSAFITQTKEAIETKRNPID